MSESVLDAIKAESEKFADLTTEGGSELSDLIAKAVSRMLRKKPRRQKLN